VTTDIGGDPDDSQSMVRLLVYANEFEIEGLVASASGTPGELGRSITRPDLIRERVKAYRAVLDNLKKHDVNYPDATYLLDIIKSGNKNRGIDFIGQQHDSEASEHIIAVVDKDDPRPVNIAIWGGQTDLAQALWRVRNDRSPEALKAFIAKIRVYDIADQDGLFDWITRNFPNLWYILSKAPDGQDKRNAVFRGMYLGGDEELTSTAWLQQHVTQNHGPLGQLYPNKGLWTAPNPHGALKEGDTPSWFYFLHNGLHEPSQPHYGGWGGRYEKNIAGLYRDAQDQVDSVRTARATVWRWRPDFQNDFAARMDRCVAGYSDVNHNPRIVLNDDDGALPLKIVAKPGEKVQLSAKGSQDPDNDELSFRWWFYQEPSAYKGELTIQGSTMEHAIIHVPDDTANNTIHVIFELSDDGQPPLKSYRRIIIQSVE
jgi:hypothetical protein